MMVFFHFLCSNCKRRWNWASLFEWLLPSLPDSLMLRLCWQVQWETIRRVWVWRWGRGTVRKLRILWHPVGQERSICCVPQKDQSQREWELTCQNEIGCQSRLQHVVHVQSCAIWVTTYLFFRVTSKTACLTCARWAERGPSCAKPLKLTWMSVRTVEWPLDLGEMKPSAVSFSSRQYEGKRKKWKDICEK